MSSAKCVMAALVAKTRVRGMPSPFTIERIARDAVRSNTLASENDYQIWDNPLVQKAMDLQTTNADEERFQRFVEYVKTNHTEEENRAFAHEMCVGLPEELPESDNNYDAITYLPLLLVIHQHTSGVAAQQQKEIETIVKESTDGNKRETVENIAHVLGITHSLEKSSNFGARLSALIPEAQSTLQILTTLGAVASALNSMGLNIADNKIKIVAATLGIFLTSQVAPKMLLTGLPLIWKNRDSAKSFFSIVSFSGAALVALLGIFTYVTLSTEPLDYIRQHRDGEGTVRSVAFIPKNNVFRYDGQKQDVQFLVLSFGMLAADYFYPGIACRIRTPSAMVLAFLKLQMYISGTLFFQETNTMEVTVPVTGNKSQNYVMPIMYKSSNGDQNIVYATEYDINKLNYNNYNDLRRYISAGFATYLFIQGVIVAFDYSYLGGFAEYRSGRPLSTIFLQPNIEFYRTTTNLEDSKKLVDNITKNVQYFEGVFDKMVASYNRASSKTRNEDGVSKLGEPLRNYSERVNFTDKGSVLYPGGYHQYYTAAEKNASLKARREVEEYNTSKLATQNSKNIQLLKTQEEILGGNEKAANIEYDLALRKASAFVHYALECAIIDVSAATIQVELDGFDGELHCTFALTPSNQTLHVGTFFIEFTRPSYWLFYAIYNTNLKFRPHTTHQANGSTIEIKEIRFVVRQNKF